MTTEFDPHRIIEKLAEWEHWGQLFLDYTTTEFAGDKYIRENYLCLGEFRRTVVELLAREETP